jgi:hypothetical protein
MEPSIVMLAGLSAGDLATLSTAGVTNSQDLMILDLDDIAAILPTATILLRKKLTRITTYIAKGNTSTSLIMSL